MILLLTGIKHSGKTETAKYLTKNYGWIELTASSQIKQITKDIISKMYNMNTDLHDHENVNKDNYGFTVDNIEDDSMIQHVYDVSKIKVKTKFTYRQLQGWIAIQILHKYFGENVFMYNIVSDILKYGVSKNYVISDSRFDSNIEFLKDFAIKNKMKIKVISIDRYDMTKIDVSKRYLVSDKYIDLHISNKSSLEKLYKLIDETIKKL